MYSSLRSTMSTRARTMYTSHKNHAHIWYPDTWAYWIYYDHTILCLQRNPKLLFAYCNLHPSVERAPWNETSVRCSCADSHIGWRCMYVQQQRHDSWWHAGRRVQSHITQNLTAGSFWVHHWKRANRKWKFTLSVCLYEDVLKNRI